MAYADDADDAHDAHDAGSARTADRDLLESSRMVLSPPVLKKRAKRSERSGTGGRLSSKTGTRHQWGQ